MNCPKCNEEMRLSKYKDIEYEQCRNCGFRFTRFSSRVKDWFAKRDQTPRRAHAMQRMGTIVSHGLK